MVQLAGVTNTDGDLLVKYLGHRSGWKTALGAIRWPRVVMCPGNIVWKFAALTVDMQMYDIFIAK